MISAIKYYKGRFFSTGSFSANVLTLMTGTTIAQIISFLVSPVLTRLYSPGDYGILAIFMSITGILGVFINGRYDQAIILPKDDEQAMSIVVLSISLTTYFSFFILLLLLFFNDIFTHLLNNQQISKWLYYVPLVLFLTGVYQVFYYWLNRQKQYKEISGNRIIQSVFTSGFNLGLGFSDFKIFGLIFGQILGNLAGCLILGKVALKNRGGLLRKSLNFKDIHLVAHLYRQFPINTIPAALFNVLGHQLPTFMLAFFFDQKAIGLYYLGFRLLNLPMSLIGSSFADVSYKYTVDMLHKDQPLKSYMENVTAKLLTISIIPFFLFVFFGNDIFRIIFGEKWEMAGLFVQILAPFFLFRFLSSPITIFAQKNRTDLLLKWQIVFCVATAASLAIGGLSKSIISTMIILSASYSLCYLWLIMLNFKLSNAEFKNVIKQVGINFKNITRGLINCGIKKT